MLVQRLTKVELCIHEAPALATRVVATPHGLCEKGQIVGRKGGMQSPNQLKAVIGNQHFQNVPFCSEIPMSPDWDKRN